jgi:hypothetical protein
MSIVFFKIFIWLINLVSKKNPANGRYLSYISIFGYYLLTLFFSQAHFDRERIPERVVHAKGAGAHGVFGM